MWCSCTEFFSGKTHSKWYQQWHYQSPHPCKCAKCGEGGKLHSPHVQRLLSPLGDWGHFQTTTHGLQPWLHFHMTPRHAHSESPGLSGQGGWTETGDASAVPLVAGLRFHFGQTCHDIKLHPSLFVCFWFVDFLKPLLLSGEWRSRGESMFPFLPLSLTAARIAHWREITILQRSRKPQCRSCM